MAEIRCFPEEGVSRIPRIKRPGSIHPPCAAYRLECPGRRRKTQMGFGTDSGNRRRFPVALQFENGGGTGDGDFGQ